MDDLGRDYLLLALGVGRLGEGIVDSYFGPPEIRVQADARAAEAAELAAEAMRLRERVAAEPDEQRARWLDRQLRALETLARRLGGEEMDYLAEVERCFDARPQRSAADAYAEAHARLDELLPGAGDLSTRLEQRRRRLTVPVDRLEGIVGWLIGEIRRDCARHIPIPAGESLSVSLVSGQPWSAYNWYDGELRSRIEINTDLPMAATEIIGLLAHEAFPGHHLEHAWKEQRLYREAGHAEASVMLINTPEAYVSEGLAEVGVRYLLDEQRWQELLGAVGDMAGIGLGPGEQARQWQINQALRALRPVGADAALLLHHERRPREEVLAFIREQGLRAPDQAEKNLEFISHPLWRTYVFCYSGGEGLLGAWCAAAGDEQAQRARFFRLLTEQLTPSSIAAELGEGLGD